METNDFNQRTQRLHFAIFNYLFDKDNLTQIANELFELLPKTYKEFEDLGITKKDIEDFGSIYPLEKKRLDEWCLGIPNNDITIDPPEMTKEMNTYGDIYSYYCLLYQIFRLLHDKNKEDIVLYHICTMYSEMMNLQSPKHDATNSIICDNLMILCALQSDISDMNRIVLYKYCFLKDDDYDKWIDDEIRDMIIAYFKHGRTPRDLFHTDHRYILDDLIKDWFTKSKVKEAIKQEEKENKDENDPLSWRKIASYNFDPEAFGDIPADDKDRMFRLAQRKLQSVVTMYSFRVLYPRESYNDKKRDVYTMEMFLYDRVLFNNVHATKNTKLIVPEYYEPENFIAIFKNVIIIQGELKKGVYMALYLALKEVEWTQFQLIFPEIEDDAQKKYDNTTLAFFMDTIAMLGIRTDVKKNILNEVVEQSTIKKTQAQTTSRTDKTFLKGLLFVCMWEKSSYRRPCYQDILENFTCNFNKKNPTQGINEMCDSWTGDHFHRLFKETPIENLSVVLKDASKLLKMSELGLDFSKFQLEDNFIYSEDLLLALYNFSRIERESIPNLMNIMNLLRERQKEILPIYEEPNKLNQFNKFKLIENNHKKLQEIDIGFTIPQFKRTLAPFQEIWNTLRNGEWDGRHIITPITGKFICETDRVHNDNGKINYIESNKKALDSVYLYKIRNQATHYSNDETIGQLLKPKNIRQLFIILLEANKKYKDWNNKGKENDPLKIIAPLHAMRRIQKLIQTLAILLLTLKKEDLSIEVQKKLQFMLDENPEQSLKDLEDYILKQEKLGEKGISLKADNYENILSEKQMKEFMGNIFKIYKIPSKEDLYRMSPKDQINMQNYIQKYALDLAPMAEPINKTITQILNFVFISNNADYRQRTQYDDFLKMYHGESAFYLLYLLQHFGNGLATDK